MHIPPGLPIVVLVTDGAVSNERDIVAFSEQKVMQAMYGQGIPVRTHTFGIGPYCNRVRMFNIYGCVCFVVCARQLRFTCDQTKCLNASCFSHRKSIKLNSIFKSSRMYVT